jgi:ribosome biogenesis GTPase / thiamine phosphate phosphatase
VSAPSGVGKSTLINALVPEAAQRTAEVGERGRGRHTTTLGRGIPWGTGLLVDLPGVRSFGLFDDAALDAAYPDVAAAGRDCYFGDCAHGPEPDCGVKAAVARGEVDAERLESWRRVRQSILEGQEGAGRPGRPRS